MHKKFKNAILVLKTYNNGSMSVQRSTKSSSQQSFIGFILFLFNPHNVISPAYKLVGFTIISIIALLDFYK